MTLRRAVVSAVALAMAMVFAGCETNPATGRSQLNFFSLEQEVRLGTEAMAQLTAQYGGRVGSPALSGFVTTMGMTLASEVEEPYRDLPWEFTLLDSDVINAFALPGGKVFVSRGLAVKLTDEAQLAGVVGHEIGHVTARHGGERISHTLLVQGIMIGAASAAGESDTQWVKDAVPLLVGVGGQGYLLSFSRDQELEADKLGMRYMVRQGYDPSAMIDVMETLAREGGGNSQPEFLSTHPYPETRIKKIKKRLENEYAFTQGNPDYKRYQRRYRQQFLNRLSRLPRPGPQLALADTASWCAVCAAEERRATTP